MPVGERGQGEPTPGQNVPFSGHVQTHTPGERRAFAPAATEDTGARDSPPEGAGFEPSVPPCGGGGLSGRIADAGQGRQEWSRSVVHLNSSVWAEFAPDASTLPAVVCV